MLPRGRCYLKVLLLYEIKFLEFKAFKTTGRQIISQGSFLSLTCVDINCVLAQDHARGICRNGTTTFHWPKTECALAAASHGYILGVHMNKRTLLNWGPNGTTNSNQSCTSRIVYELTPSSVKDELFQMKLVLMFQMRKIIYPPQYDPRMPIANSLQNDQTICCPPIQLGAINCSVKVLLLQ